MQRYDDYHYHATNMVSFCNFLPFSWRKSTSCVRKQRPNYTFCFVFTQIRVTFAVAIGMLLRARLSDDGFDSEHKWCQRRSFGGGRKTDWSPQQQWSWGADAGARTSYRQIFCHSDAWTVAAEVELPMGAYAHLRFQSFLEEKSFHRFYCKYRARHHARPGIPRCWYNTSSLDKSRHAVAGEHTKHTQEWQACGVDNARHVATNCHLSLCTWVPSVHR